MNGVLGYESVMYGYTGTETTWANEMNIVMNHAPGLGLTTYPNITNSSLFILYKRKT